MKNHVGSDPAKYALTAYLAVIAAIAFFSPLVATLMFGSLLIFCLQQIITELSLIRRQNEGAELFGKLDLTTK